jgi:hypothetical protein
MIEIFKVPFNRSYWVVAGKLLAGGYPGSEDPMEEERKLKGLSKRESDMLSVENSLSPA